MNGSSLISFSRLASVTAILVGCLVLVGWAFDLGALKRVVPGLATMKINTALCFVLTGFSLWMQQRQNTTAWKRRSGLASASAVAAIGGLTLGEYLLGLDLGIDQFLLHDLEGNPPGRMSLATAVSFIGLGLALVLLNIEMGNRSFHLFQFLALATGLLGFLALLGYAYDIETLYQFGPYRSMALHTTILLIILSCGILCARPDSGFMATVMQDASGSLMMRRLMPVAIIVPLVLGWLRLKGQRAGLYNLEFGIAMHAAWGIIIFTVLIWSVARSLNRADGVRKQAEERFGRLAAIVESSDDAVVSKSLDGIVISWNKGAERLFGYTAREAVGKPITLVIPPDYIAEEARIIEHLKRGERIEHFETVRRRKDGREIHVSLTVSPIRDAAGTVVGSSKIARDITARKRAEEALKSLTESLEQQVQTRTAELNQRAAEAEMLNRGMANLMEDVNATYRRAESTARQLEAANKELEAFSYSISHDLRAPLRHLNGFADLLQKHVAGDLDEKGNRYLRTICESAEQMGRLVDDLLSFSRMGRTEMCETPVHLGHLVKEILHEFRPDMEGRSIAWTIGELPEVYGDQSMLRQVLMNLVGNAVKYTRHRDQATIAIGCSDGMPGEDVVFVRDNGAGFDMQYAHKLFGVFQRLHSANEFEGTGIGLANVRRIIARHGGRTWADGKVDEGATFYFSLPKGNGGGHDG